MGENEECCGGYVVPCGVVSCENEDGEGSGGEGKGRDRRRMKTKGRERNSKVLGGKEDGREEGRRKEGKDVQTGLTSCKRTRTT